MKFGAKTICILPAALVLALALAGCGNTPASQPATSLPASVPDTYASRAQSEDGLLSEDEVANHVPSVPLEGAPEFLTREQQQLYLDAYDLYATYFGTSIGGGMLGSGEPELREVDGYTYQKAQGEYAKWEDFWAALTAVFTKEYAEELVAPVNSVPVYENLEGDTWFLAGGARGANIDWVGPDTFLAGDADDEFIEFYVVGHYEKMDTSEAYEEDYPLTLMKTDDGWRFSQFHITF